LEGGLKEGEQLKNQTKTTVIKHERALMQAPASPMASKEIIK
jgi:hypothetical protein